MEKSIRIAILQRVIPSYRVALFEALTTIKNFDVGIYIGSDIPNSKVRSSGSLGKLKVHKMHTSFLNVSKGRQLINHQGLIAHLSDFNPDVILCEGESSFLSYLKAIWYRRKNSTTGLIHWSLGGLPGSPSQGLLQRLVKSYFLSKFDAFVVYSSYGQEELLQLGCPRNRIHVAVNVSDTKQHLAACRSLVATKEQARAELKLPDQFTVIYAGSLENDKRVETLIEALGAASAPPCNLVILGEGPSLSSLKSLAVQYGLRSAFFPGRVSWDLLAMFYRAGNVFVLPGRGGMVMSEAMAHGLPVIVHHADGTEVDLVEDGVSGYRLSNGSPEAICEAIKKLWDDPDTAAALGAAGQRAVEKVYTLERMVHAIEAAVIQVSQKRKDRGSAQ